MAPSSASGGSSASAVRCVLGSGLGWGSAIVGGEGTIGRHSWTTPARYEGVGAESCGVVDCLAANALELLVASPGDSDSKVLRKNSRQQMAFAQQKNLSRGIGNRSKQYTFQKVCFFVAETEMRKLVTVNDSMALYAVG